MKRNTDFLSLALLTAIFMAVFACNDPTTVGGGIVDDNVKPITIATFEATATQGEPVAVATYSNNALNLINQAQCGTLEDPVFGRSEASFAMQFMPTLGGFSTEGDRIIDSVYFILFLDTASSFVYKKETVTIGIRRLNEHIEGITSVYDSEDRFALGEEVVPAFSFEVNYSKLDTPDFNGSVIRIPLPNTIGEEIFNLDSTILNDFTEFPKSFRGFHVYPVDVPNQYVGFRPYSTAASTNNRSGIRVYYRNDAADTTSSVYNAVSTYGDPRSPVVQQYDYDYTGSEVEAALAAGDNEKIYIQGNGGVTGTLEFNGIPDLGNVLVNKAELFIPFDAEGTNYNAFPEINTLFMTNKQLSGNYDFIPEFSQAGLYAESPIGRLDTIDNEIGYAYNIPLWTQSVVEGTIVDDAIRLQNVFVSASSDRRRVFGPANMQSSPQRSVIIGSQDSSPTIRLIISYTSN